MGDVVDFEAFKAAKLKRLEEEWDACMSRSEAFQKEGKHKFAGEMLEKAKALRVRIDKLRKPKPKVTPILRYSPNLPFTMTYSYLSSADMGHRSQISPEPENN